MGRPVVCGIHDAEHALAAAGVAATLASRLGRGLELIHVSEPGAPPDFGLVRMALDRLGGRLAPGDVTVRLESGDPEVRLSEASREAELLVIGATEDGILRRALGHDVPSALTRDAAAPVVVVAANDATDRGELPGPDVVCGVRDRRDVSSARAAARIARGLGGSLILAHVVQAQTPTALVATAGPPLVPQELCAQGEAVLEHCSEAVEDELAGRPQTCVEAGIPGHTLVTVVQERRAGLLAVGSPSRGPLAAALGAAASRHVLRHSAVPVMVCPRADSQRQRPVS